MKTFLFLIFVLGYSQSICSQTETSIDTLYRQDFKDFTLQLVRDDTDEEKAEFRTLYIDKKSGEATKIFVSTYKKGSNYIGLYPHTGAFGYLAHSMEFNEYKDLFYFHIKAGQQYGGKANILGYFNPKTNEMYDYIPNNTLGKRISDIDNSFETLKEEKETSLFIKKLLIRLKLAADNIEISYLFSFKYQNFTYFLYLKDNSSVEILRHDIEKRQWFVGGYSASPSIDDNKINSNNSPL